MGTEGKHRNKVRSPNRKAVGHCGRGQPTPTAAPLRNAHVIEESDRGVGTERAHTKSEHDQAIVMLLREAIKYSEHGFPRLCETQLTPENVIYTCVSGGSSKPRRSLKGSLQVRKGASRGAARPRHVLPRTALFALTLTHPTAATR